FLKRKGYPVGRTRVQRLMQLMGLQAIYPKPKLSKRREDSKVYPYLLKEVEIVRPFQVWCSDITYIPMKRGFLYLVAIMDWFSRFVISWELSNTLDVQFCLEALESAMTSGKPEIFNSDQGCQYTSKAFTGRLLEENIRISMDGKGRCFDNIFIERLWRSLKYEDIYLKDYEDVPSLIGGLTDYFAFYNYDRPHQGLKNARPAEIHFDGEHGFSQNQGQGRFASRPMGAP
ncbi:MAG: IS3 family transposase, partial [Bacteroidota bacterium]